MEHSLERDAGMPVVGAVPFPAALPGKTSSRTWSLSRKLNEAGEQAQTKGIRRAERYCVDTLRGTHLTRWLEPREEGA